MEKNQRSRLTRLRTAARVSIAIATLLFTGINGAALAQGTSGLIGAVPGFPQVEGAGAGQTCTYDSSTSTLTLEALSNNYFANSGSLEIITGGLITISAILDASGIPTSGTLTIAGTTTSGLTDPLLTGDITLIGLEDSNGSAAVGPDRADLRATPTGGSIFASSDWPAGIVDITASIRLSASDYAGSVATDWSCQDANMTIGAENFPAPTMIDVNDYVGQQQATAETNIGIDGLTVGTVTAQIDAAAIGEVLAQNPVACMACAAVSDPVDLTISAGPVAIDINDYTGQLQADAEAAILLDNLTVGTITMQTDASPAGTVIGQFPAACTDCATAFDPVDLTVSSGPALIDVNDYTGQQQADAELAIVADGLTVGTVTMQADAAAAGTVIAQNPVACLACAAALDPVDLTVSTGPVPIDINDYTGQQQADAEAAIVADGLTVGEVTMQADSAAAGTVIAQNPVACMACADPSDPVDLTVSTGPAPPTEVAIDVQPGDDTGCLQIDGNGVVPVAVLGSLTFDVDNINQESLTFQGLEVSTRGGTADPQCGIEDVNGDGEPDLVCKFQDDLDNWIEPTDDIGTLMGLLDDSTALTGSDNICLVKKKKSKALSPLILGLLLPLAMLRRRLRRA